ncbi:MAG: DUF1840 domain-containing protein [Polaromonas sp.]|nr:DUF1840 domain-containing protein [Polaromonas sp.]
MLYKFKSKTTGDLIMLEPNGRRILEIIGKTPTPQGILLVAHMPAAIASLEEAIAQEQIERQAAAGKSESADAESDAPLGLRQRALPFIDMLKRCRRDGSDLVWGV